MKKKLSEFDLYDYLSDNMKKSSANDASVPASPRRQTNASAQGDAQKLVNDISKLVQDILKYRVDITTPYDNWIKVGFALKDALGEGGREVFHAVSSIYAGYNATECDKKYDSIMRSTGDGITVATLFHLAKEGGIVISDYADEDATEGALTNFSATCANVPSAKSAKNSDFTPFLGKMACGALAHVAHSCDHEPNGYTFSDQLVMEDQVEFLRPIFELHGAEPAKCDAQLLGVLTTVSGLMGGANGTPDTRCGVYGLYDGKRVFAPTFTIVYSGPGNDKGNLVFCKWLLRPIKNELAKQYEAERKAYEIDFADWEAKAKKGRGPQPKEPVYRDPFLPGNSSSSAVYRGIANNNGWGVMFETEADTISNMLGSDFGNYSEMMRKAFHHEPISMNRTTDNLHIDIEEPRLAIFLTCTPGQLPALFPSFENGLGSRFLFYNIPDEHVTFHNVFALNATPYEDHYRRMGDQLLPLYHALQARKGRPLQFVMSQKQQEEFLATYSSAVEEQFQMLGQGIRPFMFRSALTCFRYSMILTVLRRLSEWHASLDVTNPDTDPIFLDQENALICDDRDFRTAMTIVGCLINHTARVYAVLAKEDDNPFASKGIKLKADELEVYHKLPDEEFRTADFVHIAGEIGITSRTASRMLGKFANKYRIVIPKKAKGHYQKAKLQAD